MKKKKEELSLLSPSQWFPFNGMMILSLLKIMAAFIFVQIMSTNQYTSRNSTGGHDFTLL